MIEAFYEIVNKPVDRTKTWYSIKDKTIYVRGIKAKYFLECIRKTDNGIEYFIILCNDNLQNSSTKCHVDNYGRLKLKLKSHHKYLNDCLDKDSNINFIYDNEGCEDNIPYIVYKISVH